MESTAIPSSSAFASVPSSRETPSASTMQAVSVSEATARVFLFPITVPRPVRRGFPHRNAEKIAAEDAGELPLRIPFCQNPAFREREISLSFIFIMDLLSGVSRNPERGELSSQSTDVGIQKFRVVF